MNLLPIQIPFSRRIRCLFSHRHPPPQPHLLSCLSLKLIADNPPTTPARDISLAAETAVLFSGLLETFSSFPTLLPDLPFSELTSHLLRWKVKEKRILFHLLRHQLAGTHNCPSALDPHPVPRKKVCIYYIILHYFFACYYGTKYFSHFVIFSPTLIW